jgi:hypothetical protein
MILLIFEVIFSSYLNNMGLTTYQRVLLNSDNEMGIHDGELNAVNASPFSLKFEEQFRSDNEKVITSDDDAYALINKVEDNIICAKNEATHDHRNKEISLSQGLKGLSVRIREIVAESGKVTYKQTADILLEQMHSCNAILPENIKVESVFH